MPRANPSTVGETQKLSVVKLPNFTNTSFDEIRIVMNRLQAISFRVIHSLCIVHAVFEINSADAILVEQIRTYSNRFSMIRAPQSE